MTIFGQNLVKFASKNNLRPADVNEMFGWNINSYRDYTQNGRMPSSDKWLLIVQKTGIPESEWKYNIITDDEIPLIKFTTLKKELQKQMIEEDAAHYGPMIKLDYSPLLEKIADLERRLHALEKQMSIAKE